MATASLEERVGASLRARGCTLATAESCTGGLLGHRLTEVPGSSDYYLGGIIAYADAVKVALLGVSPEVLARDGAVSEAVACQMAQGVRQRLGAQIGVGITGIAGPTGGTPEKPVGLVFIAVAGPEHLRCERHVWPYDRSGNKAASARRALEMVLELLEKEL
ncbi:MAG: CinA family protein [Chloroflexia bacterium]